MASITCRFRCALNKFNAIGVAQNKIRQSSYKSSLYLEDVGPVTTKYDVTKNPEEWKFVERVLPPVVVPTPIKKNVYPSGWKPQAENLQDRPYFIARTKNHMIPVYLCIGQWGILRRTMIKKIQGDIWLLQKEIKEFLQKDTPKPVRSQVNEFAGYILINGDHVNAIKYWLEERNF